MALPPEHFKALDQLRLRLSQLSTSIGLLRNELEREQPLPTWPELQTAASSLGSNLQNLAATLSSQRQLFSSEHAYPLPDFPGHTQEGLLQQLLRKKLDPKAEAWISESLEGDKKTQNGTAEEQATLSSEDTMALWSWAGNAIGEMRTEMEDSGSFRDDYTLAERQAGISSVITGIKRKLGRDMDSEEEDDDEDDEDGNMDTKDEEMKDGHEADASASQGASLEGFNPTAPPIPLDTLLRFATGSNPLQAGSSV
ncbi:RNA polymerase II mediator complex component Med8 like protein [Zymoseptoria brevis]|uniref:Mediator of RNA polymerase II transcription subunit 8 n=1 Tax=Zymoseptoria brevis TaxID=1047168 RepID=A0A0F4GR34_9PEZI|nr:RNA polymerase II mediator complex component Med8 like protein [Zymoseptoria brevis]